MTLEQRAELVLACARVLYVNGQSTDETVAAAARLGHALGLRASIIPRWGELEVKAVQAGDGHARFVSWVDGNPTGVDMHRVASTMDAVGELSAGQLQQTEAIGAISAISEAPPAPTWTTRR